MMGEMAIENPTYVIYVNGRRRRTTKKWKEANYFYNYFYQDMFEHNYVEIICKETGEILRGGAK